MSCPDPVHISAPDPVPTTTSASIVITVPVPVPANFSDPAFDILPRTVFRILLFPLMFLFLCQYRFLSGYVSVSDFVPVTVPVAVFSSTFN